MELLNGQELQNGKYRILKVLGVGSISITYLAVQVNLRRKVVIKELFLRDLCVRDEGTSAVRAYLKDSREIFNRIRMRFVNEARSLAELNHRNVVSVFDMFNEITQNIMSWNISAVALWKTRSAWVHCLRKML